MFRLITCSPKRAVVGPDCLKDTEYHAVVSYRTNVNEAYMSKWKAFSGGYAMTSYLYPFLEITDEYSKAEFRDMASLPLKLSDEDKRTFIFKFLEHFWEYQSRYYFISNNCVTESARLLQAIVRDKKATRLKSWTPSIFRKALHRQDLSDETVLENELQAGDTSPTAMQADDGYGIPLFPDTVDEPVLGPAASEVPAAGSNSREAKKQWILENFGCEIAETDSIDRNLVFFFQRMTGDPKKILASPDTPEPGPDFIIH